MSETERSETLPYLQANKLCCPNFMETDRRQKTSGSETRDGFIHHRKRSNQIISIWTRSLSPNSHSMIKE